MLRRNSGTAARSVTGQQREWDQGAERVSKTLDNGRDCRSAKAGRSVPRDEIATDGEPGSKGSVT